MSSSRSSSSSGWSKSLITLSLAFLSTFSAPAQAGLTCDTSLGTYYPYCINVPDNANGKLPAILFLSGSGARGDASNVKSLSGYDGFGKLINQYYSGNKGDAQKMAAEQFVTIIPISPKNVGGQEIRHWMPDNVQKVVSAVKSQYGDKIDWSSLHLSGYSMGSRGTWRNGVANPGMFASFAPAAGGAEQSGDGTLSQQKAPSVFDKLSAMAGKPVWQFDGSYDTTAGTQSPKATQAELQKLGDGNAKLTTIQCDHSGLSTKPFTVELMQWMLKQGGGGRSSSSTSTSSSSSDSDDVQEDDTVASSTSSSSSSKSTGKSSKSCSSGKSSRKAKRSEGYAMAHAGPARRGVYGSTAPVRRSLSLSAILANREATTAAKKQEKRSTAIQGAIALDSFPHNDARSFVPPEMETVMQRRDPALVAREALKQSAAARVGKRMTR